MSDKSEFWLDLRKNTQRQEHCKNHSTSRACSSKKVDRISTEQSIPLGTQAVCRSQVNTLVCRQRILLIHGAQWRTFASIADMWSETIYWSHQPQTWTMKLCTDITGIESARLCWPYILLIIWESLITRGRYSPRTIIVPQSMCITHLSSNHVWK